MCLCEIIRYGYMFCVMVKNISAMADLTPLQHRRASVPWVQTTAQTKTKIKRIFCHKQKCINFANLIKKYGSEAGSRWPAAFWLYGTVSGCISLYGAVSRCMVLYSDVSCPPPHIIHVIQYHRY